MPDPTLSQINVAMYSTSTDAAAKLEIEGISELGKEKTTKILFLEAVVRGDDEEEAYEMVGDRKIVQYLVRKGFGVRISMQVSGWSTDMSLSLSSVTAKALVAGQSVQYYLETLGLPESLEKEVLAAVGIKGLLNENSFVALRKLVSETLPEYLRKTPADSPDASKGEREPLELVEYRVPVEDGADTFDAARGIHFAMTHLARGDSLAQALQSKRNGSSLMQDVGEEVIQEIYQKYAGISPSQTQLTPPADAVNVARKWLAFQP